MRRAGGYTVNKKLNRIYNNLHRDYPVHIRQDIRDLDDLEELFADFEGLYDGRPAHRKNPWSKKRPSSPPSINEPNAVGGVNSEDAIRMPQACP